MLPAFHTTTEEINVNLEGLPKELKAIAKAIETSADLLSLEPGWDGENAIPVEREIWKYARIFLMQYARRVFNLFSLAIGEPDINPCPNGSIDLSWRTKKARMLVNVRRENGEVLAFFYGDLYDNKMSIKGNVPAGTVEDHLACWMKNLV